MRAIPTGLTAAQHQAIGRLLARMKPEAAQVRRVIKEGCGSATPEYQAGTALVAAIKRLQQTLLLSAAGEHAGQVPTAELRGWYERNGDNPCTEENGA